MTPRRPPRPRASLRVGGLLLLLVAAAAGIALAVRPVAADVPLDPRIPNGRALIARSLSGVPNPGQPTTPIAVDRLVTDGILTYVQFHLASPAASAAQPLPFMFATLSDNTPPPAVGGRGMNSVRGTYLSPPVSGLPLPIPIPSWFPWRPLTVQRGVMRFEPLAPTTHVAVLQFGIGGVGTGETVRVPVNLDALRRVRAYTGPLVQRAGLQLRVVAARDTGLVLGYGVTNDATAFGDPFGVTLRDARGRTVPLTTRDSACATGGLPDVQLTCRRVWTYPLQPRRERLMLSIQSIVPTANSLGPGPWRLSFVVP
jgi:hypothetical protein